MPRYIYPKPIQEVLNSINKMEKEFFENHPHMQCFMREAVPQEFEAQEYRMLMEPNTNFEGCRGCAKYVFVVISPERKIRLHFFAQDTIQTVADLDAIASGLSILLKAKTEEEWSMVRTLMFENDQTTPHPFTYASARV